MASDARPLLRKYLRREDAAVYLGVAKQTLANWAVQRKGPHMRRLGRACVYDIADLDAFVATFDLIPQESQGNLPSAHDQA
ncbi:MAG: helix-turn-helix domain-containing protein [Gemmatimonadota bacterium]|nr:helix-turn-helix domain-containing protein [Gemmatimonadota bacterium]